MFKITFVCTGNRCRSAVAAELMRGLTRGMAVGVDSCGTLEAEGLPPPAETIEVGGMYGLDLAGHRSRYLGACELGSSDLVLGFELTHCAGAVVDGGAHRENTFLIREMSRLLGEVPTPIETLGPEERARVLVGSADEVRSHSRTFVPGEEIADPMGSSLEEHQLVTTQVAQACRAIATALFGAGIVPPSPAGAGYRVPRNR